MLARADAPTAIEIVGGFLSHAPVDLDGMAAALGLKIIRQRLSDDVSGKIERGNGGYVVTINSLHSSTRQRFTQAHEIAHYVLHRDLIGDGIVDDALYRSAQLRSDLETQANRFAADILMPASILRRVYRDEGVRDIASLTQRFGVSPEAMKIRLNSLGLGA